MRVFSSYLTCQLQMQNHGVPSSLAFIDDDEVDISADNVDQCMEEDEKIEGHCSGEQHQRVRDDEGKKAEIENINQNNHELLLWDPDDDLRQHQKMTSKLEPADILWRKWKCSNGYSPFIIWKRKFICDYQCTEENIWNEVILTALPHIATLLIIPLYITFGALMLMHFDDLLAQLPFHKVILFAFTTVVTIGYGDVVPTSSLGKLFCTLYCIIGIPLVFITLSKIGQLFAEFYWICLAALRNRKEDIITMDIQRLPLAVIAPMILVHSVVGGLLFNFMLDDEIPLLDAIYFCFISITTIGFGDICPKPTRLAKTILFILYLSSGISIMSTMFGAISDHLRRIHYLGRGDFEHTQDVRIWYAGRQITIRELVSLVARQFGISPYRLREVLEELDSLLQLAATMRIGCDMGCTTQKKNCGADEHPVEEAVVGYSLPNLSSEQSLSSSIDTEQEQMIQALSTLHRLGIKGARTFHSHSLNSFTTINNNNNNNKNNSTLPFRIDSKRFVRSMSTSPYNTMTKTTFCNGDDEGIRSTETPKNNGSTWRLS